MTITNYKSQITDQLSPELRFLIACCQTEPSKDDTEFIQNSLLALNADTPVAKAQVGCSTINQQLLTTMALRHGILPLVYKTLKELNSNAPSENALGVHQSPMPHQEMPLGCTNYQLPEHLLADLKSEYSQIARRNMLMSAELIRIMKILEENNIKALTFKGPTLSQMAYGDITLRQYVDLDVLTRKEDVYKIDSLLKSHGYERLLTLTPNQEKIWIMYAHDMGFIHSKKGVHFEMHWSFLDEDYPMQVHLEDFWKETQEVKINGHSVLTFSHENLLVYLCIHGSKHLWERIEWIKDIDLLVRENEIDWQKVIEKSKGTGFEKMIYLGFSLSSLLLDTPLPRSIQNEIYKYQQLPAVSTFILESWSNAKTTIEKTKAMLKLFPGIKEQVIYLHKIIFKPSFNEYWYIDFPKRFYWLYYFLRPYLLIKKYFTKQNVHNS